MKQGLAANVDLRLHLALLNGETGSPHKNFPPKDHDRAAYYILLDICVSWSL